MKYFSCDLTYSARVNWLSLIERRGKYRNIKGKRERDVAYRLLIGIFSRVVQAGNYGTPCIYIRNIRVYLGRVAARRGGERRRIEYIVFQRSPWVTTRCSRSRARGLILAYVIIGKKRTVESIKDTRRLTSTWARIPHLESGVEKSSGLSE